MAAAKAVRQRRHGFELIDLVATAVVPSFEQQPGIALDQRQQLALNIFSLDPAAVAEFGHQFVNSRRDFGNVGKL